MKQILQTLRSFCQVSLLVAALGVSVNASANEGGFPLDAHQIASVITPPYKMVQNYLLIIALVATQQPAFVITGCGILA